MWKPEEIRAALRLKDVRHEWSEEHGAYLVSPSEMNDYAKLHFGACEAAKDYGPDCEPLPVDEAFCRSLGFDDAYVIGMGMTIGPMMLFLVRSPCGGIQTIFGSATDPDASVYGPAIATRPQLRSLLAALGGGM